MADITSRDQSSSYDISSTKFGDKRALDVNVEVQKEYATIIDDVSPITYIGKAQAGSAKSGAVWQIKKMVETGPDLEITFADGNANFDNIWDNRASLTYS